MDDMSQLDQAKQEWIKRIVLKNPVGSGNPLTPVKTRQSWQLRLADEYFEEWK
jgi:hypothetical protein